VGVTCLCRAYMGLAVALGNIRGLLTGIWGDRPHLRKARKFQKTLYASRPSLC
jgi:hypothetical protein